MPTKVSRAAIIIPFVILALQRLTPVAYAIELSQEATVSATATVPATLATSSDTLAPSNPILVHPQDGSLISDNQPEFVWLKSSDPNGNVVTYTLYLNGVATYLGISNIGNSSGNGYTARLDGSEVKLRVTTPIVDGVYNWSVSAQDGSGNTARSTSWSLTIDTMAPLLTLVDLDTHHLPPIIQGSNFDIVGPKNIDFAVQSDPSSMIQLSLTQSDQSSTPMELSNQSNGTGLAYFAPYLNPGVYIVTLLAVDPSGNITILPDFTLTITQAELTIPLPDIPGIPDFPQSYSLPYTPLTLPSLPATIANLRSTSYNLPSLIILLLAIFALILLILAWKKKYNLILLNPDGHPLTNTKIYHSIPSTQTFLSPILMTDHDPLSYTLASSDHGQLYIKGLRRYSTLTIITKQSTIVLSLSVSAPVYTLTI